MINIWFTADTHLGHNKILEYEKENRQFSSIEEHDEALISNWNSVVNPNDIVMHLGDFCLGGQKNVVKYGSRLNGRKRLIMGNHDVYPIGLYLEVFERVFGSIFYKEFTLSHVPLHPEHTKNMVNLHGHLHSRKVMSNEIVAPDKEYPMNWMMVPDMNYLCVSVEQNNLMPFHIDEIRQQLKEI